MSSAVAAGFVAMLFSPLSGYWRGAMFHVHGLHVTVGGGGGVVAVVVAE